MRGLFDCASELPVLGSFQLFAGISIPENPELDLVLFLAFWVCKSVRLQRV